MSRLKKRFQKFVSNNFLTKTGKLQKKATVDKIFNEFSESIGVTKKLKDRLQPCGSIREKTKEEKKFTKKTGITMPWLVRKYELTSIPISLKSQITKKWVGKNLKQMELITKY